MTSVTNNSAKKRFSVKEFHQLIFNNLEEIDLIESEIKELEQKYFDDKKELIKKKTKLSKEINNTKKKLFSQFDREIVLASKEKRKRKGPNTGGIMKVKKWPKVFMDYMELDEDIKMSRPQLVSALNEKFKKDGFRQGKDIKLNKKTAKLFGKKVDKDNKYLITFRGLQTFISEVVNKEKEKELVKPAKNKNKIKSLNIVV